jgi:hypothetical protein
MRNLWSGYGAQGRRTRSLKPLGQACAALIDRQDLGRSHRRSRREVRSIDIATIPHGVDEGL